MRSYVWDNLVNIPRPAETTPAKRSTMSSSCSPAASPERRLLYNRNQAHVTQMCAHISDPDLIGHNL